METHNLRVFLPHLLAWRSHSMLSITELSERAGVGRDTIINLEHGRTQANPRTVRALAGALGISPRQLVDGPPPTV